MQRVDLLAAERRSLARLEHDDVQARRGQNACRRSTARAGADDAHVAIESQFTAHALGLERQRELRDGAPQAPATRRRLVVVGWLTFVLTLAVPILGVVALSYLD